MCRLEKSMSNLSIPYNQIVLISHCESIQTWPLVIHFYSIEWPEMPHLSYLSISQLSDILLIQFYHMLYIPLNG